MTILSIWQSFNPNYYKKYAAIEMQICFFIDGKKEKVNFLLELSIMLDHYKEKSFKYSIKDFISIKCIYIIIIAMF